VRSTRGRRANGGRSAKRTDLSEIRTWAKQHGHSVSDRGRIQASILEAYDAAH
jgi:hypothetical protein